MRTLIIEDDPATARYVCNGLEEVGHSVTSCANGLDGLHAAVNESWDLIILDRLLPGGVDGLSILAQARKLGKSTPVLILSALTSTDERVRGLRAGGDDYISKPFAFVELMARVEALLRRSRTERDGPSLQVADLTLDLRTFRVMRGDTPIPLKPRELRLLTYLMRYEGQVVTRAMLLDAVWDCHFDPQTNVVDVQISRLRSKVDKGFSPPLIHTIRSIGYVLGVRAPGTTAGNPAAGDSAVDSVAGAAEDGATAATAVQSACG
jgi:two-component system, OmpR family, response regulator